MKYKDFKWRLAWAYCSRVLLPIYLVLEILCLISLFFESDNRVENVTLISITLTICFVVGFFGFVLLGHILYRKQIYSEDAECIYLGRLKMEKTSISRIELKKLSGLYMILVYPLKGADYLKYYFTSDTELFDFLYDKESLDSYLSLEDKEIIQRYRLQRSFFSDTE